MSAARRRRRGARTRSSRPRRDPRRRGCARTCADFSAATARSRPSSRARITATIVGRTASSSVPRRPKMSTSGVTRIGPEREAGVAAQREEAHPLPAAVARDLVGEARALGMEGGDADAAEPHRRGGHRVVRAEPDERHAQPGQEDAERQQPRQREAIGAEPEERLDGRRADARDEDEHAGGAVGDAALVDEERQQRRHRALRRVGARVPRGQDREAAAVEPGASPRRHPVQRDAQHAVAGALGVPAVAAAQVAVGPADEVEQQGRGLLGVLGGQRAVGDAVLQQAPDRLGEGLAGQAARALLVEDRVVVGLGQRGQQLEVGLDRLAVAGQRLLEALAPAAAARSAQATCSTDRRPPGARTGRPAVLRA